MGCSCHYPKVWNRTTVCRLSNPAIEPHGLSCLCRPCWFSKMHVADNKVAISWQFCPFSYKCPILLWTWKGKVQKSMNESRHFQHLEAVNLYRSLCLKEAIMMRSVLLQHDCSIIIYVTINIVASHTLQYCNIVPNMWINTYHQDCGIIDLSNSNSYKFPTKSKMPSGCFAF